MFVLFADFWEQYFQGKFQFQILWNSGFYKAFTQDLERKKYSEIPQQMGDGLMTHNFKLLQWVEIFKLEMWLYLAWPPKLVWLISFKRKYAFWNDKT